MMRYDRVILTGFRDDAVRVMGACDVFTLASQWEGLPVAVMAADPFHYGGSWTADACAKITRFVDTAETFHMPIVHLNDCPGFFVGVEAERTATIRAGVRVMAAINQSTVPWCTPNWAAMVPTFHFSTWK